MTYQALARKWRPRRFADVVGQTHVVAALTHALDNDRVHHAFLFTGTRGVGKTTLARLLAKSLNCEKGVSSTPCGECSACQSVEQNRFVDLLEIDAASRTRVDDTREILDNVQYAPTMGRYKVYLVDEVHMLSTHSFNALLKTLEEPPPHVKFLLATTDPQKLPPTILSRCLQFNLRALQVAEIATQLERILAEEDIASDADARELLARAADGSMRDALSLLDQAIAFAGGELSGEAVRAMLGMIEGARVVELLEAVVEADTAALFGIVDAMRERSANFARALDDLLILLHEIAVTMEAPELTADRDSPWKGQLDIAERMNAEQVQLFYQVALIGKRDLSLAPDPARGFEMVMLRMLAFEPSTAGGQGGGAKGAASERAGGEPRNRETRSKAPAGVPASSRPDNVSPIRPAETIDSTPQTVATPAPEPVASGTAMPDAGGWSRFAETDTPEGLVRELAMNLEFVGAEGGIVNLRLDESLAHLLKPARIKALEAAASARFGPTIRLKARVSEGRADSMTPAVQRARRLEAEQQAAVEGLSNDPELSIFINQFDAELVPESVQPGTQRGK